MVTRRGGIILSLFWYYQSLAEEVTMRICMNKRVIKIWLSPEETTLWAQKYSPNSKLSGVSFHAWYGYETDGFSTWSHEKPFGVGEVEARDLRLIVWHHLKGISGIETHPEWGKIFWPRDHKS